MTETEKEGRWYNNCHEYGKYGDSWEEIEKWMYPDPSPVKGTEEWRLLFSKFQKGGNSTGTRKNLSKANEMKAEQGEKAAAKFKGRRRKKGKLKIRSQKKDRSQTKLKKFFEVKKNSEGYPMQHCKYHPVLSAGLRKERISEISRLQEILQPLPSVPLHCQRDLLRRLGLCQGSEGEDCRREKHEQGGSKGRHSGMVDEAAL
jgi:hypothetical protein